MALPMPYYGSTMPFDADTCVWVGEVYRPTLWAGF